MDAAVKASHWVGPLGDREPASGHEAVASYPKVLSVVSTALSVTLKPTPIFFHFVNYFHNRLSAPWSRKSFVYSIWSSTRLSTQLPLSTLCINKWQINRSQGHHTATTILLYPHFPLLTLLQRVCVWPWANYLSSLHFNISISKWYYTYFHHGLFVKLNKRGAVKMITKY